MPGLGESAKVSQTKVPSGTLSMSKGWPDTGEEGVTSAGDGRLVGLTGGRGRKEL